jgi:hypothetical protein
MSAAETLAKEGPSVSFFFAETASFFFENAVARCAIKAAELFLLRPHILAYSLIPRRNLRPGICDKILEK